MRDQYGRPYLSKDPLCRRKHPKRNKRKAKKKKRIPYSDYLHSKRWLRLRKTMKAKYFHCLACGKKYGLHLHHVTYKRYGQEIPDDLIWLCQVCHQAVHDLQKNDKLSLLEATREIVTAGFGERF